MQHNLVFRIDEPVAEYCSRCQQLGPSKYGVKMHRNLPLQTWSVEGTLDGETRWVVMCSDCLNDANEAADNDEEKITVLENNGTPFTTAGKLLLRA